ncbi:MAG TPA: hypothetical protein VGI39_39250 [Polyangiaceae bacterium]
MPQKRSRALLFFAPIFVLFTAPPAMAAPPVVEAAPEPSAPSSEPAEPSPRPPTLYLLADASFARVDTGAPFVDKSDAGHRMSAALGVGAGVRIAAWTLGVRARVSPFGAFTLLETNAEAGFHLPFGHWDPYVSLHAGYARAFMTEAIPFAIPDGSQGYRAYTGTPPSPDGPDLGGALGIDYFLTERFSLGAEASLDALFISTNGPVIDGFRGPPGSVGSAFLAGAHAGLHFEL